MKVKMIEVGGLWCFITLLLFSAVRSRNLFDIIGSEPQLEKFYSFVSNKDTIRYMLSGASLTVFAPTNAAWDAFLATHRVSDNIINYHIAKSAISSSKFPVQIPTETIGGPPLFVTRRDLSHNLPVKFEFFANQALIIKMDITGTTQERLPQVLHIIDEVLMPTLPQVDDVTSNNPSAFKFLSSPQTYSINYDLSRFKDKVVYFKKNLVYQGSEKGHTFFIPVNGNSDESVWSFVDDKVIDGHIIPEKVFFSRAFPSSSQPSQAFTDNLKSLLRLRNESYNQNRQYDLYAQSNVVFGWSEYRNGTVLAKILKADIPVQNGVIHLIENPLIVVTKNLFELLQQFNQLSGFYDRLKNGDPRYSDLLTRSEMTVFAPTNDAFNASMPSLAAILNDKSKTIQMLNCHLTYGLVPTADVISGRIANKPTLEPQQSLHFGHTPHNVTVVGCGVKATLIIQDVRARNGIVHVMNNVLGIPYNTIYDKLSSDPALSLTFELGKQDDFNEQFKSDATRFTYFVPINGAWEKIRRLYTSEYFKLYSGKYSYHVKKLLNRHLVVKQAYSLHDLHVKKTINMVEGKFSVVVEGGRSYLNWEGLLAEILQPDIEVGNGRIHVIREVFFKASDLTTSNAPETPLHSFVTLLLSWILVLFII